MSRRVVVTGMGGLCCLGETLPAIWDSCLKGKAHVAQTPRRWAKFNKFKSTLWAPLPAIDYAARGIPRVDMMRTDPVTLNMCITVSEALENAGLVSQRLEASHQYAIPAIDPQRTGVYMGTAVGGVNSTFKNHSHMLLHRNKPELDNLLDEESKHALAFSEWQYPKRLNGFIVPMLMPNAVSAYVAIKYSIVGPNVTTSLACAAGTSAIGQAYRAIQQGQIDTAICGGSEYLNDEYGSSFKGFDAAGTLTTSNDSPETANRPFDAKRNGFLFSEGGAATLILEEYQSAKARGANILGEICGYGESFDAYNMMRPEPSGSQAAIAVNNAIADSGLSHRDIGYINTHGTGTLANDETEANLIGQCFAHNPLVTATKSLTGHMIGASGALETVISLLSLQQGMSHGILNLEEPIADLNFCVGTQSTNAEFGLTQSFAFGGHNIALVVGKAN